MTLELSKSKSLLDVSVTRNGDTFPGVFRRLYSDVLRVRLLRSSNINKTQREINQHFSTEMDQQNFRSKRTAIERGPVTEF